MRYYREILIIIGIIIIVGIGDLLYQTSKLKNCELVEMVITEDMASQVTEFKKDETVKMCIYKVGD